MTDNGLISRLRGAGSGTTIGDDDDRLVRIGQLEGQQAFWATLSSQAEQEIGRLDRSRLEGLEMPHWDRLQPLQLQTLSNDQLHAVIYRLTNDPSLVPGALRPLVAAAATMSPAAWSAMSRADKHCHLRGPRLAYAELRRCRYCKRLGHQLGVCPDLAGRRCTACGRSGHYFDACPDVRKAVALCGGTRSNNNSSTSTSTVAAAWTPPAHDPQSTTTARGALNARSPFVRGAPPVIIRPPDAASPRSPLPAASNCATAAAAAVPPSPVLSMPPFVTGFHCVVHTWPPMMGSQR